MQTSTTHAAGGRPALIAVLRQTDAIGSARSLSLSAVTQKMLTLTRRAWGL